MPSTIGRWIVEVVVIASSTASLFSRPIVVGIEFIFACDTKIAGDAERLRRPAAFTVSGRGQHGRELNSLFNQRMPSARARRGRGRRNLSVRRAAAASGVRPAFNRRWPSAARPVLADEFTSLPAAHVPSSPANRIDSFITSYVCPVGRRSLVVRCFNIDCICRDVVDAMLGVSTAALISLYGQLDANFYR